MARRVVPGMTERKAAEVIWRAWSAREAIDAIPEDCRPANIEAGYRVQDALIAVSGEAVVGYKIAATSKAGQTHLAINHPISGRILASRVFADGDTVPISDSRMALLETEFAFVIGEDLPARAEPYEWPEVMARVARLHLAIELPDTRFVDVAGAGAPQLIAECACADRFLLGPEAPPAWRDLNLAEVVVSIAVNGTQASVGLGADALGDPRFALAWLANQLSGRGMGLKAGEIVTTGICGMPTPGKAGDHAVATFEGLGNVEIRLS